jgi:hypothetical protein
MENRYAQDRCRVNASFIQATIDIDEHLSKKSELFWRHSHSIVQPKFIEHSSNSAVILRLFCFFIELDILQ